MGLLGRPLGTYLRVQGVVDKQKSIVETYTYLLLVDRIDQRELSPPVRIWVENLELPAGERVVISGYESGRWVGLPDEVQRAEGLPQQQGGWNFQRYFVVTSVQAPFALAERFRPSQGG